jgi:hypothetical protein
LSIRTHDYGNLESGAKGKEIFYPHGPLHIEKIEKEMMSCILKGVYKQASHNPNSRAAPNYSIVDNLAQTSCVMSTLEVLQIFPMQHTALLSVIRVVNSSNHLTMNFDAIDVKPHLPYHVAFHIGIVYVKHIIRRTIIDKGTLTCVMSLS